MHQLFIEAKAQPKRRRPRRLFLALLASASTLITIFLFSTPKEFHPLTKITDEIPIFTVAPAYAEEPAAEALNLSGFRATSYPMTLQAFEAYTSPFGYRTHPIHKTRRFHYGLDISADVGDTLYAWADGTVVLAGWSGACGYGVAVQSGDWYSVYCHCVDGSALAATGDTVKAGQPIAKVGVTGGSTGPHLHWGLKYQGKWVDPTIVLQQMRAQENG